MTTPNHILDWPKVSAQHWRQRNAEVERCARAYLAARPSWYNPISTMELAQAIYPQGVTGPKVKGAGRISQTWANLSQTLARMAPHMGPLCTHDGEVVTRFKKQWRRWQWRGQLKPGQTHGPYPPENPL